jgi:hypothetical protein
MMPDLSVAIFAYRQSRFADAIAMLELIAREQPDNWHVFLYLSMAWERSGNTRVAHAFMVQALSLCRDQQARPALEISLDILAAKVESPLTMQPRSAAPAWASPAAGRRADRLVPAKQLGAAQGMTASHKVVRYASDNQLLSPI